jgi:hypothetical protein
VIQETFKTRGIYADRGICATGAACTGHGKPRSRATAIFLDNVSSQAGWGKEKDWQLHDMQQKVCESVGPLRKNSSFWSWRPILLLI